MMRFWNWVKNEDETRTLYLNGVIAENSWFDDDITPAMFKEELFAGNGPITLHISSPGGDCVAASQIYTMLMYYPGDVTVHIDGLAASAASVIAMAGTKVCMSPTSLMFIHNPFTSAIGDSDEMRRAIQMLDEVKESIINAYQLKTGLSRARISHLMDGETWLNAVKAKQLGFCDEILYTDDDDELGDATGYAFERKSAAACLMNRVIAALPKVAPVRPGHPPDAELLPAVHDCAAPVPAVAPESSLVVPATAVPAVPVTPSPGPEEPASAEPPPNLAAPDPVAAPKPTPEPNNRVPAAALEKRLSLLK